MKNRNSILAFVVIGIFLLSSTGQVSTISAQVDFETNFELSLFTQSGSRIRESYALYVKQALVPLGIDVTVIAKPFGQFVGDLLHLSTGTTWDLAIVSFTGGQLPDFEGIYNTESFFGDLFYQLTNPDVQEFFLSDTGLNLTTDVDPLILGAVFTLDPIERWTLTDQFAQLYMDQLLYDLPLVKTTSEFAVWRGFGGPNNELHSVNDGFVLSSFTGANFADQGAGRNGPATTLQDNTVFPAAANNLDVYQVADTATGDQSDWLAGQLSQFWNNVPYPSLAYNWFIEDIEIDLGNSTHPDVQLVEKARHTFIVDTDMMFSATVDVDGVVIPAHNLDANDVRFALDYLMHPNSNARGDSYQLSVANYSVSTTVTTDDTITIDLAFQGISDFGLLGGIVPLPEHILGGTLELANGTTFALTDDTFNPSTTLEWLHWQTVTGNSYVGPFEMNEFELDSGFYSMSSRSSDWTFPNEKRTLALYDANTAVLDAFYASLNTTGWGAPDLSTYAGHLPSLRDNTNVRFFDWAGFDNEFAITDIVYKIFADDNTRLVSFENGQIDSFGSSSQGLALVQEHRANAEFVMNSLIASGAPQFMAYDLTNEHLKFRDVRYAIASVIDKEEMAQINDGFAIPAHSPVSPFQGQFPLAEFIGAGPGGTDLNWYVEYAIPVDFATARDLMRNLGYTVADTADEFGNVEPPVDNLIETIGATLGVDAWIGLSALAVTSVVLLRRKRDL
jgi:hypothetical protein